MGIARLYKAGTPYNAADLSEVDFEQSADIVYLAHLNYPPEKLVRGGHTSWTFSVVTFGPTISPPVGITATPSAAGAVAYSYVVTSIDDDTAQESRASIAATCNNDLTLAGHSNAIAWTANGSDRYTVYKSLNGVYGYIGETTGTSFTDDNIAADLADTPPVGKNPFATVGNYPSTVTFFDQRSMWARTLNKPNGVWGSQPGDFENMDTSKPAKADDALAFGIVASRVNAVNQLASMKNLIALTTDAIFQIDGGGADQALTPAAIVSRRQSGRGASRLNPIVIDDIVFFRPSQGSSIRTLGYTFEVDGYRSNNISIFSPHLFEGYDIVSWAYQQEPYAAIWAVRDDGLVACLTWEQDQQVWGWSLHDFGGKVEDIGSITEDGEDRIYLAVRRTLGGVEDVFIERMSLPVLVADNLNLGCYLDCAVSQVFDTPTAIVSQLWHLEGETVSAFHDGNVTTGLVVVNGGVTLPEAATTVTVGLPYKGYIETMPLALQGGSGSNHAKLQMMARAVLRCENTRGLAAGVPGEMFEIKQRQGEPIGTSIQLKTGDFDVDLPPSWNGGATIVIEQNYPLPATISAIFAEPIITA